MLQEIEKLINHSKLRNLSSSRLEEQIEKLLGEDYSLRGGYDSFERVLRQLCVQGVLESVKASGSRNEASDEERRLKGLNAKGWSRNMLPAF